MILITGNFSSYSPSFKFNAISLFSFSMENYFLNSNLDILKVIISRKILIFRRKEGVRITVKNGTKILFNKSNIPIFLYF